MSIISKKYLSTQFGEDFVAADNFISNEITKIHGTVPAAPKKPILKEHTSKAAKIYSEELAKYENDMTAYKISRNAAEEIARDYRATLKEYIEDVSGVNSVVPVQYRDKVKSKAWEAGHSGGYTSYANELMDLAHIFE